MPVHLDDLHPYRSLLLATCPNRWGLDAAVSELRNIAQALDQVEHVALASNIANRHGVQVAFFYYRIKRPPAWLLNKKLEDTVHELVVIFRRATSVAVLASERRLRRNP